jgi:hypothetical protein
VLAPCRGIAEIGAALGVGAWYLIGGLIGIALGVTLDLLGYAVRR